MITPRPYTPPSITELTADEGRAAFTASDAVLQWLSDELRSARRKIRVLTVLLGIVTGALILVLI